jgi:hypothetical protein
MTGKKLVQILKAIAYPFARLYDLVHNGQDDIEASTRRRSTRPVRKRLGRVQ